MEERLSRSSRSSSSSSSGGGSGSKRGGSKSNRLQASPTSFQALARMFNPRRTTSMPVGDVAISVNETQPSIKRSLSAPLKKTKNLNRTPSPVFLIRAAGSLPRLSGGDMPLQQRDLPETSAQSAHEQEIPLEQAVCRICMDELEENGKMLKAECSCKGELALAHEACALKWFAIKGNRTCEICGDEVRNLPVTLTRVSSDTPAATAGSASRPGAHISSFPMQGIWQDLPVLIMLSMIAYFCMLEQLLVRKMGSAALVTALPFAAALGLMSSIISATLVPKKYIWGYAILQFVFVIFFAYLFYIVIHMEPVLAILLSAFAGFGIAMSINGICVECSARRSRNISARNDVELVNGT